METTEDKAITKNIPHPLVLIVVVAAVCVLGVAMTLDNSPEKADVTLGDGLYSAEALSQFIQLQSKKSGEAILVRGLGNEWHETVVSGSLDLPKNVRLENVRFVVRDRDEVVAEGVTFKDCVFEKRN